MHTCVCTSVCVHACMRKCAPLLQHIDTLSEQVFTRQRTVLQINYVHDAESMAWFPGVREKPSVPTAKLRPKEEGAYIDR